MNIKEARSQAHEYLKTALDVTKKRLQNLETLEKFPGAYEALNELMSSRLKELASYRHPDDPDQENVLDLFDFTIESGNLLFQNENRVFLFWHQDSKTWEPWL